MTPAAKAVGDGRQKSTAIASQKSPKIDAKERKKRTSNPGIRQQGGRIYDSENGTTCHQCRQKTIEIKAKCNHCTLYFCPRCLENRYNESVDQVNALPDWSCPRCRKLCNCSNCRKKAGLEATGILAKVAKTAGFDSVSELLKKNPKAQALHLMTATAGDGSTSVPGSQASKSAANTPRPPKSSTRKRKIQTEEQLLDDSQLSPRKIPMPEGAPIALHKRTTGPSGAPNREYKGNKISTSPLPAGRATATPGGSSKRQRGPAWLDKVPDVAPLPTDVDPGQLASILEFISVFSATPALGLRSLPNLAALATELVQPATTRRTDQICPVPEDSLVAMVHMKLLDVVRHAWEVRGPPVSLALWQQLMRPYYAAEMIPAEAAAVLIDEYGPSAVAGELFARRMVAGGSGDGKNDAEQDDDDDTEDGFLDGSARMRKGNTTNVSGAADSESNNPNTTENSDSSSAAYLAAAAAAAAIQFPEGGYWGLDPGMRVQMLYTLLHDALDTYTVRQVIEKSMENAAEEEKGRRSEVADVRRAAKEAATKQRDQEIAILVAGGGAKQMTLEEQRALMDAARQKADEAASAAAAAKLKSLSQVLHPATVRNAPLGQDRDGLVVFKLQSSAVLTGNTNGLILCGEEMEKETKNIDTNNKKNKMNNNNNAPGTSADAITNKNTTISLLRAQLDPAAVIAALDPRGKNEGPLRHAIADACKVSLTSPSRKKVRAGSSTPGRSGTSAGKSLQGVVGSPRTGAGASGTPKSVAKKKASAPGGSGATTPKGKASALKSPKSAKNTGK